MGKREFIVSRWNTWEELEDILKKNRIRGIRSLDDNELFRLISLYRSATADLSKAQAAEPFGDVVLYLNQLVARTRAVIYVNPARPFRGFRTFIMNGFPSIIRKHSRLILLSALLFFMPSFLGYYWMAVEPGSFERMLPGMWEQIEMMNSQLEEKPSLLASGTINPETMPLFSSFIMVNNIRISIFAFGLGITFGLGTLYLLVMNGTFLGCAAYLYLSRTSEYTVYFLAGILPHAVFELTAIILSGAAGFIIAGALIAPGNLRRGDALRFHGRDAVKIMYGVVLMLVIAALIEAFITPVKSEKYQNAMDWLKIAGSIVALAGLLLYFGYSGRAKMGNP